jgi:hypothetical protein
VGPTVGKCVERRQQILQNSVSVLRYLAIRVANGAKTSMFVDAIAHRIFYWIVRIAVDFDDQSLLRAEKIDDAVTNHMLPAEFESAEL